MNATRHVVMRDGTPVLLRPLEPADATLYPDFIAEVTPEDFRLRFFAPMRELQPEMVDRLTHNDPARAIVSIAIEEQNGRMLGVVRLHDDDTDSKKAEFAIIVRSHLKGHGLGWLMMQHMIAGAKEKGLQVIHGEVLAENHTMLDMCRHLGFVVSDVMSDRGIKRVTLDLADLPAGAMH